MTEPLLEARAVTKSYGAQSTTAPQVLSPIDLKIGKSEFLALIGPSGCGKTTLLKILAGLLPPTSGEVRFKGRSGYPTPERMGFVFQSAALLPWRNVLQNVVLPAEVHKRNLEEARGRARELLAMLNLSHAEKKYPHELSGGMQQRVSIARALVLAPEVLFMDEPFGALDAMTRERLNLDVQSIHAQTGTTVVFVTHNIEEAVFLSDRIIAMAARPGRIGEVIEMTLPRPRTQESYVEPEFIEMERRVRHSFDLAASSQEGQAS